MTDEQVSIPWSLLVGGYAFFCSALVAEILRPIITTMIKTLLLPADLAAFLIPGSAAVIGGSIWWLFIGRPAAYTYSRGVVVGVGTALSTAVFGCYS